MPFTVSILILFLITITEAVGLFFGAGLSDVLSHGIPDVDDSPALSKIFSWLYIGQVPLLILLILFLVGFALSGLLIQKFTWMYFQTLLPAFIAAMPAFYFAIMFVRVSGYLLVKIMPKDETAAVSLDTLIGGVATIISGTAKNGYAAQAKVKDGFGKHHYIMVQPDNVQDEFLQGTAVLLVKRQGHTFAAIKNTFNTMQEQK